MVIFAQQLNISGRGWKEGTRCDEKTIMTKWLNDGAADVAVSASCWAIRHLPQKGFGRHDGKFWQVAVNKSNLPMLPMLLEKMPFQEWTHFRCGIGGGEHAETSEPQPKLWQRRRKAHVDYVSFQFYLERVVRRTRIMTMFILAIWTKCGGLFWEKR